MKLEIKRIDFRYDVNNVDYLIGFNTMEDAMHKNIKIYKEGLLVHQFNSHRTPNLANAKRFLLNYIKNQV